MAQHVPGTAERVGGTRKVRNTESPQEQEDAILTAARKEFEENGIRKTGVDDVAQRAGVSRSTLYRRFPNKEALLMGVAERVYLDGMRMLEAATVGYGPQDSVVEAFVAGAQMVNDDPLIRRMMLDERDALQGITKSVTGLFIEIVTGRIMQTLRGAGAQMPDDDLHAVTEILVRLVISFLDTPPLDEGRQSPESVREFAQRYLAPMVR
ncbi:TetR/AcrR family transcriptional regulator [Nocardia sp. 348MFTsu5.1]|uniref:TetR/AcrR family transcriptional regulator n=1 Tax=Nocardia sp. 348MFTsu5.1 TaxID=1172185 RepID=UPI000369D5AA|nr:TetR/AcrR family transcriptional regulator [Nocardia sp. 348MFTsu5.1]